MWTAFAGGIVHGMHTASRTDEAVQVERNIPTEHDAVVHAWHDNPSHHWCLPVHRVCACAVEAMRFTASMAVASVTDIVVPLALPPPPVQVVCSMAGTEGGGGNGARSRVLE